MIIHKAMHPYSLSFLKEYDTSQPSFIIWMTELYERSKVVEALQELNN